MPGAPVQAGDTVPIVATPGAQGEVTEGRPVWVTACVAACTGAEQDMTVVSVMVPKDEASELAACAGKGVRHN